MRGRAQREDDRGVVLILVAVGMVAILIITAMAIDLGAKRADRRADQQVVDLASISAGSFLAGYGSATVVSNPQAACKAARTSVMINVPSFNPTQNADTTCGIFPLDAKTGCNASTAPQNAVFSDATYTLTIRYPIPDSEITDSRFSGSGLSTNAGTNRCERMKITFDSTAATQFAGIIGVNSQTTGASSIVRASTSQTGQGVAALLLLERVGCGTLQNSGQGAITVNAPSATNPGVIQADTAGQVGGTGGCTTNNNAGGWGIWGPSLPASAGGGPSVIAQTSSNGTSGIIAMYSLLIGGRGGAVFPGGLSVDPVAGPIASRQNVDDKYNGTSNQITNLHSEAWSMTAAKTEAEATAAGFDAYVSGSECNGNVPAAELLATNVFVSCSTFDAGATTFFPNATRFVATGEVNIQSGRLLGLPQVQRLYIRGCGACGGGSPRGLRIAGVLLVNTGEASQPASFAGGVTCAARRGPGSGGTTTNWTRLAVMTGPVDVTGQARLCQTTVYMGRNTATYAKQTVTQTAVAPETYPTITQCSTTLPCPKDGVDTSSPFAVSGGGSATDWTAPNQYNVQPGAAEFAVSPLEDLALWTETSSINVAMKGQAGNLTEGVFFLPNASAVFQGQGSQPIDLNAQFLIRKLNMSGQGNMTLSPNPADAVIIPIPGALAIIK